MIFSFHNIIYIIISIEIMMLNEILCILSILFLFTYIIFKLMNIL